MPNTLSTTRELEKLVRLCMVFSHSPEHLRLLDAVLRVDPQKVNELLESASGPVSWGGKFYPMLLQLVIDHGHPAILEEFASTGNTTSGLSTTLPSTCRQMARVDVEDACAWRLSTERCITLIDHGMLQVKSDTFDRLLMLADASGFDRLLDVVFGYDHQPQLIASEDAAKTSTPWHPAISESSIVGPWMAAWRVKSWDARLLPLMHPVIQTVAHEMDRRWNRCVDALLEKTYPSSDPCSRLQAMLSDMENLRIDLAFSDFDRVDLRVGIIERAMALADAQPSSLPEGSIPANEGIARYDSIHALMQCGFRHHHFPSDPLSVLLSDAGLAIQRQGNKTRFSDNFINLYSRIVNDLANAPPDRLAALPLPFGLDPEKQNDFTKFTGHSINHDIDRMSKDQAAALGNALILHATTTPTRSPSMPTRRM